jgi:PAS domain-containing protein
VLPLRSGDDAIAGVLVLSSPDAAWFDADEVRLLDEMAMDVGFAMDVSRRDAERTRATAALRDSQVRLERAARAGNVGLWEWSLVSDTVYYSSQWKRQLGYEDSAIAPDFEAWRSRIHPDDVERAIAAIGEYLRGQAPHLEIEYRCRHKDGTYRSCWRMRRSCSTSAARRWRCSARTSTSRTHRAAGAVPPGPEDGEPGPPRRRHRARLQQPADDHQRHRRPGAAARPAGRRARRLARRPRRRRARATLTRQLLAISRKQVLQVEVLDPNEVLAGIEGLLRA